METEESQPVAEKNRCELDTGGGIYKNRGKINEAVDYFELAVNLNPNYTDARYELARILQEQRKDQQAATHFRVALKQRTDLQGAAQRLA